MLTSFKARKIKLWNSGFGVNKIFKQNNIRSFGTPLVVQWLRICLPMHGTQVQSLVGELRSHTSWGN